MEKIKSNKKGATAPRIKSKKRPSYIKVNFAVGATATILLIIISCLFLFI
ncbi:hypothetical protein [Clostridium perfringens]